jgi:hypothetical protein
MSVGGMGRMTKEMRALLALTMCSPPGGVDASQAEAVPLAVMLGDAPPPSLVHLRTGRLLIPMVPPADDCDTKLP